VGDERLVGVDVGLDEPRQHEPVGDVDHLVPARVEIFSDAMDPAVPDRDVLAADVDETSS
jgi:hypothetical protein